MKDGDTKSPTAEEPSTPPFKISRRGFLKALGLAGTALLSEEYFYGAIRKELSRSGQEDASMLQITESPIKYDADGRGYDMVVDGHSLKDPKYFEKFENDGFESLGVYLFNEDKDVGVAIVSSEGVDLNKYPNGFYLEGGKVEGLKRPYAGFFINGGGASFLKEERSQAQYPVNDAQISSVGRMTFFYIPEYAETLKSYVGGWLTATSRISLRGGEYRTADMKLIPSDLGFCPANNCADEVWRKEHGESMPRSNPK